MRQKVFIQVYDRELVNAYSVRLASELTSTDATGYGIKSYDGTVIVERNTDVSNPSTGLYEYTFEPDPDVIYKVAWEVIINQGDEPEYTTQEIGPFSDPIDTIRVVADFRGRFIQYETSTVFLTITDMDGDAQDPTSISLKIQDAEGTVVVESTNPEKISTGFYAFDWQIAQDQAVGEYTVVWTYNIEDNNRTALQQVYVAAQGIADDKQNRYIARVIEMREALSEMLHAAQHIGVYREQAKQTSDRKKYKFTFQNWNQSAGVRVYRNDKVITSGLTINYFKGEIIFDEQQTPYDRIEADYNFRWFADDQLDRFLSNSLSMWNLFPAYSRFSFINMPDSIIPPVLWGASVDAIRNLMLSLQFQEPQLVFGGQEAADKRYANLEGLKKNYEESWNKALEQKKNGPYRGLMRMIIVPEFSMPGGRSRWFRYMFSGGS